MGIRYTPWNFIWAVIYLWVLVVARGGHYRFTWREANRARRQILLESSSAMSFLEWKAGKVFALRIETMVHRHR